MKKLKNAKGFTLVETLTCMIMLVLLGGICSTGMNVAMKSYQKTVFESNSQTLASSLELYINDILRYATDVKTDADAEAVEGYRPVEGFTNPAYQMYEGMIAVSTAGETKDKMVIYTRPDEATRKEFLLVGLGMYGNDMYVADFTLKYNATTQWFEGEYKIKSVRMSSMVRTYTFGCRTISE